MDKGHKSTAENVIDFWTCNRCTFANDVTVNKTMSCEMCGKPRERQSAKSARGNIPLFRCDLLLEGKKEAQHKKKSREKRFKSKNRRSKNSNRKQKDQDRWGLRKPNDINRIKELAKKCVQEMQLLQEGIDQLK